MSYFTLNRHQSYFISGWICTHGYIQYAIWNRILPGVQEEIISSSLAPYCCFCISSRPSFSPFLITALIEEWNLISDSVSMAAPGGVSIQRESEMRKHRVYVWRDCVCVRKTDRKCTCGDRRIGVSLVKLAHLHFLVLSRDWTGVDSRFLPFLLDCSNKRIQ